MTQTQKVQKWIRDHEVAIMVTGTASFMLGIYVFTVRGEAKEQLEACQEKNEALKDELAGVWSWIDAQTLAGAEFKQVDDRFRIDGQAYSD